MPGNNSLKICMAVFLSVMLAGCAGRIAPEDWLPSADEMKTQAYGAWVNISYTHDAFNAVSEGELIAVERDTLYLLENNLLLRIPRDQIRKLKLAIHTSEHGKLSLWTTAGAISTLSHGVIFIISMPTWIIAGSVLTAVQSKVQNETIAPDSWDRIRKYARFPQGLPPEIKHLKPRPAFAR